MWLSTLGRWFRSIRQRFIEIHSFQNKEAGPVSGPTFGSGLNQNSQGISGEPGIVKVQCSLALMGFPIGAFGPDHNGVDGLMGPMTVAAVKIFQEMVFLNADGVLNQATLTALEKAVQNGDSFKSLALKAYREGLRPVVRNDGKDADFVNAIYFFAVVDQEQTQIPAAATTVQAILETGYGRFIPVDRVTGQYSYNLFGIKGTGPAGSVASLTHETDPQTGRWKPVVAYFRAYHSFEESISEHSDFFRENSRYQDALNTQDPEEFIRRIAKAGYATDPEYAVKLIALINYWNLK